MIKTKIPTELASILKDDPNPVSYMARKKLLEELTKFLTQPRRALLKYIRDGGFYIAGSDVRVAYSLQAVGLVKLEDNGAMFNPHRRSDGERWACELTDIGYALAITLTQG